MPSRFYVVAQFGLQSRHYIESLTDTLARSITNFTVNGILLLSERGHRLRNGLAIPGLLARLGDLRGKIDDAKGELKPVLDYSSRPRDPGPAGGGR